MRSDDILEWVRGPSVLDVGCAAHVPEPDHPYWVHGRLRSQFPTVTGIDINEGNIELLRSRGLDRLQVASAESFALPDRFDTIVAGELIEHLSNPGLFLERARQHLRPGGRIVLTTPFPFSLLYLLYAWTKFPKTCQNPEHTCWICPETMRELTARAGLKIVSWRLLEDYRLDDPSARYRGFVRLVRLFRPVIPRRLRCNTALYILEADGIAGNDEPALT